MPDADFSPLFSDSNLVDFFLVQRRSAHVDQYGRSQPFVVETIKTSGIITASNPSDLMRVPDTEYQPNAINIATRFRLQGPRPGRQPDQVIWHDEVYVVTTNNDLT